MIKKILNLFRHQYTIQELRMYMEKNADIVKRNIPNNCKILIIDDDIEDPHKYPESFINDITCLRSQRNYNITTKTDLDSITDAEGYDIIICDQEGVGLKIKGRNGDGILLLKELKLKYPHKVYALCSSVKFSLSKMRRLDPSIMKWDKGEMNNQAENYGEDGLSENIELAINKFADPTRYWSELRSKMIDSDISIHEIARLESSYVKSIIKNNVMIYNNEIDSALYSSNKSGYSINDYIQSASSVINTTLSLLSLI